MNVFVNVKIKNKDTGEVIDTDENGVFANISFNCDGSIEIESLGTCVDNSTRLEPDSIEKDFDINEYEIVSIECMKI
ncbi:hypothetical protein [Anaerosacchariphilus polymeriproducens]|uniref:Uncharacterized protein n=1 Tax=Anaerosacchariphilus polymeriproducens TaxID=1812858 RepID=A0A371ATG7_9FIRM|nr:hypothetical protein [Anaerosacchariphilus polymeriproducens]RDU22876.1 hypothetical protein DWV06_12450 [Anaerosacchariphilus polymeriproducens]